MKKSRTLLLIAIVILMGLFFAFDLQQYLTLETLKSKQVAMLAYNQANPIVTLSIYMLIYIAATALSLPGAAILTLAGGGIFGLGMGTLIVSFASTIGASLAFLAARFLFRDLVKAKFGERLTTIDEGMAKEGAFYLFTLRLVPVVPFFMINLLMGLSTIKLRTFYWVSQLGMLAGTIVYVNAGTQLAKLESLSGILSPLLIGSFVLLGLFPLMTRKAIYFIENRKSNV
ncbi:MAG: VTT domain-containing protein [Methylobacter sp.]|uniref:TVP38/TMEM64 family membrane protein n=1 Tax=Candidatus Methylobacter titanis TaxID=3053457 RepID=A0AA43Q8T7_9GAMM|nr:VTT domain-containing protein [Candidatus Methylobacter titanis]